MAEQLLPAPNPGRSVAGDWLLDQDDRPGRVGSLGESLAYAWRRGYRWHVPAERWAAEHRLGIPWALRGPSRGTRVSGGVPSDARTPGPRSLC